jgi:TM2 domain-containing membrane protein YozV
MLNALEEQRPYKNLAVTVFLASLLPLFTVLGVGHLYAGALWRGFSLLVVGWVLVVLWLLFLVASVAVVGEGNARAFLILDFLVLAAYIVLWMWQVEDARKSCLKRNARLLTPASIPGNPAPLFEEGPSPQGPDQGPTSETPPSEPWPQERDG